MLTCLYQQQHLTRSPTVCSLEVSSVINKILWADLDNLTEAEKDILIFLYEIIAKNLDYKK